MCPDTTTPEAAANAEGTMAALDAVGRRALLAVFLLILAVHAVSPAVQVTDSRLSVYTAYDLLHHRSLDLSRLPASATGQLSGDDYDVVHRDGGDLPFFPYPPMALLVPVVGMAELVGVDPVDLKLHDRNETWKIEVPAASLVVAGTSVVVALIAYALSNGSVAQRRRTALVAALFFGFGTAAWSTGSRAFWQHTPAMLFLALALLQVVQSGRRPRSFALLGAFLAAAYIMRPSAASTAGVIAVWVLVTQRQRFASFAGGACVVLVPFVALNLAMYNAVLPPYFSATRLGTEAAVPFFDALALHAVSPSRGVLVYTPLFVLIPVSLRLAKRSGSDMGIYYLATSAVVVHWVVVASYGSTGGASYGARFFTEVTPMFVLLLVPLFGALVQGTIGGALRVTAVALFGLSVVFAGIGATMRSGFCWSANPVFIDEAPDRVWDATDPQFLRPVRDLIDGAGLNATFLGSCRADSPRGRRSA